MTFKLNRATHMHTTHSDSFSLAPDAIASPEGTDRILAAAVTESLDDPDGHKVFVAGWKAMVDGLQPGLWQMFIDAPSGSRAKSKISDLIGRLMVENSVPGFTVSRARPCK